MFAELFCRVRQRVLVLPNVIVWPHMSFDASRQDEPFIVCRWISSSVVEGFCWRYNSWSLKGIAA